MDGFRSRPVVRRVAGLATPAALLVIVLAALPRCRFVEDRLTGVSVGPSRNSTASCIVQCQVVANAGLRAESVVHVSRVKACGIDPGCLAAEEARHQAVVDSIQAARRACVVGCHHQGGGSGGS